jgi:IclR family transcriptional regulator, pca regulon regulatory protein
MIADPRVKQARKAVRDRDAAAAGTEPAGRFAFVRSLERGLAVIKSFGDASPEQTVADVAKAVGLDRSAARRFLLTLAQLGYVEQEGRGFRLAPKTLQLGYAYLSSLPWWRGAQRIAERLRDKVGQNCAVGVLDGDHVVYVAYASTARFPLLNRSVGVHLPALATAIGRILLANLGADALDALLGRVTLEKFTPVTVVDRRKILHELAEIRAQEFACVDQELEVGLRSIGVPIYDRRHDPVAAISISIVGGQLSPKVLQGRYLEALRQASEEITETFSN